MAALENLRAALGQQESASKKLEEVKDILENMKCNLDHKDWNDIIEDLKRLYLLLEINI
jgi:flagellin-specific chaperone FliS